MTHSARPPIVIATDDVNIFDSLAAAQAYLEPPDVTNGARVGYDSTGRAILSLIERNPRGGLSGLFGVVEERVRLEVSSDDPDPGQLRSTLVQYVNRVRMLRTLAPVGGEVSLQEIIAAAYEYARTR